MLLAELIGIGTVIFAKPLVMLFDQNPEVIAFGVDRSQIAGFFFCLLAFTHAFSALQRGRKAYDTDDGYDFMLVCCTSCLLSVTGSLFYDIQFVYWVYPLTWGLSSLYYIYYMIRHRSLF